MQICCKTATDYAFRYDGVFVDRSQAVFRGDSYTNWDFDSIPSYGWNSPNGYAVNASITRKNPVQTRSMLFFCTSILTVPRPHNVLLHKTKVILMCSSKGSLMFT